MFSERSTDLQALTSAATLSADADALVKSARADLAAATIDRLAQQLLDWVEPLDLGVVLGLEALSGLDAGMRAGVAFVSQGRMKSRWIWGKLPVPDLVVSVGSAPDCHEAMTRQMHAWLERGVEVCVLIETWAKTVSVFRSGEVETLGSWKVLSLPDVLPGWELRLAHL